MFKNLAKFSFFFLICLISLSSCNQSKNIDTRSINIDLEILRFDKDLAKVNPNNLAVELPLLEKKYGNFYHDYFQKILSVGNTTDTAYYKIVREVLIGEPFKLVQKEVDSAYLNLDKEAPKIKEAITNITYYYPEYKTPKIISYISGFQLQTAIGENYIGIGLDMFLGSENKFYYSLVESVPRYISKRFNKENIAPRIVEVIAREELFPELDKDKSLLSKMIYQGKIMYFMQQVQPNLADSVIIGYAKNQMEWATKFESDIWAYFLEENLLYQTDYLKIQKYLSEAPFTPGLGGQNDSAPKLGIFTGWQIVKNYMKNNSKTSLQELMLEKDEQKILKEAKYKP